MMLSSSSSSSGRGPSSVGRPPCSKYQSAISAFRSMTSPSFEVSIEDGASRIVDSRPFCRVRSDLLSAVRLAKIRTVTFFVITNIGKPIFHMTHKMGQALSSMGQEQNQFRNMGPQQTPVWNPFSFIIRFNWTLNWLH